MGLLDIFADAGTIIGGANQGLIFGSNIGKLYNAHQTRTAAVGSVVPPTAQPMPPPTGINPAAQAGLNAAFTPPGQPTLLGLGLPPAQAAPAAVSPAGVQPSGVTTFPVPSQPPIQSVSLMQGVPTAQPQPVAAAQQQAAPAQQQGQPGGVALSAQEAAKVNEVFNASPSQEEAQGQKMSIGSTAESMQNFTRLVALDPARASQVVKAVGDFNAQNIANSMVQPAMINNLAAAALRQGDPNQARQILRNATLGDRLSLPQKRMLANFTTPGDQAFSAEVVNAAGITNLAPENLQKAINAAAFRDPKAVTVGGQDMLVQGGAVAPGTTTRSAKQIEADRAMELARERGSQRREVERVRGEEQRSVARIKKSTVEALKKPVSLPTKRESEEVESIIDARGLEDIDNKEALIRDAGVLAKKKQKSEGGSIIDHVSSAVDELEANIEPAVETKWADLSLDKSAKYESPVGSEKKRQEGSIREDVSIIINDLLASGELDEGKVVRLDVDGVEETYQIIDGKAVRVK